MTDHPVPTPARELSDEEVAEARREAERLHRNVSIAKRRAGEALWDLARALYEFKDAGATYSLVGYKTLDDWLEDSEIGIKRRMYELLVQTWFDVTIRFGLDAQTFTHLDLTKVALVLPAVKSRGVSLDGALADVESLPASKLRDIYQERAEVPAPKLPRPDVSRVPPPPLRDGAPMDDYVAVPPPPGPSYAEQNGNGAAPMWSAPVAPPSVPLCGGCTVKDRALRLVQEYLEGRDDADSLRVVVSEALDV